MAKAMSASRWWKTNSASVRRREMSAVSLKRALIHCTTWFLSPTGANSSGRFKQNMVAPLRVGIAGLGTVGAEDVGLNERQKRALSLRCGRGERVVAESARSKAKKRNVDLTGLAWAKNALAIATDPKIDVFVELMGGVGDPAM